MLALTIKSTFLWVTSLAIAVTAFWQFPPGIIHGNPLGWIALNGMLAGILIIGVVTLTRADDDEFRFLRFCSLFFFCVAIATTTGCLFGGLK